MNDGVVMHLKDTSIIILFIFLIWSKSYPIKEQTQI